jgi:hypothetical protein
MNAPLLCSHSQMNTRIFDAFSAREQQVTEYMAGCGMKYGMDCTCGPNCRCKNCPLHEQEQQQRGDPANTPFLSSLGLTSVSEYNVALNGGSAGGSGIQQQLHNSSQFNTYEMGPPNATSYSHNSTNMYSVTQDSTQVNAEPSQQQASTLSLQNSSSALQHGNQQHVFTSQQHVFPSQQHVFPSQQHRLSSSRAQRNLSVLSYGNRGSVREGLRNSLRGMSITSETTFGRAMSGLSALSIDWENLDDFDLDVDHSAHINQSGGTGGVVHHSPGGGPGGIRRASATRRSIMSTSSQEGAAGTQVSFKVQ